MSIAPELLIAFWRFLFRENREECNMVYGYARVSSTEQNLDRQIIALEKYVEKINIVTDKASGKDTERDGYQALKGRFGLREGDMLYITSLDRLSRNKEDIKKELRWFQEKKVRVKILDLPTTLIDVPDGQEWILEMVENILIEVLSSIAEQERLAIRRRQREGIEAARRKGKHLGRPRLQIPDNFEEIYIRWKEKELTAKKAMELLGMSRTHFYRQVKRYEKR